MRFHRTALAGGAIGLAAVTVLAAGYADIPAGKAPGDDLSGIGEIPVPQE